jgi:2-polyprenyl-6-methoxyphenol hydroxylase-like FAD-dependent oxidoreductase
MGLSVLVAGAGVGGLCLAQGLRRAGITVRVVEREPGSDGGEGYRLRLEPNAVHALVRCLPPELVDLFRATCNPSHEPRMSILDHRLTTLVAWDNGGHPANPARAGAVTNRRTLREVLLAGLDDTVAFGREVVRVEDKGDAVCAYFADGTVETADVLVAADGVDSAIRAQLAPGAELVDAGVRAVYGRTRLDPSLLARLPDSVVSGSAPILGPDELTLVVGVCQPGMPPPDAAADIAPHARLSAVSDCLQWTLVGPTEVVSTESALRLVEGWHPTLVELVARADGSTASAIPIRAAWALPSWPAGRITLLGDAVHPTTPVGGTGASLALRDAALLTEHLTSGTSLPDAIAAYERQMREYGLAAAQRSLRAAEQIFRIFIPELD